MRVPNQVQNETQLKKILDILYDESKQGKSFTGILELAMNDQTIITAIHNIKSNRGAKTAGIDKKVIDNYLQMPFKSLIGLVKSCFRNYNPKPVRRHYIEKKDGLGKKRPLGIPTVIDRIIQECLKIVLEPIAEAKFFEHSYGYRPYRAQRHAVRAISYYCLSTTWAIEGDIRGYFDNINHSLLLRKLHKIGIIDKRVLAIIKKMLQAGVLESGQFHKGTPQGGILSPLLANIYLNDFDWTIARRWQIPLREKEFTVRQSARRYLTNAGFKKTFLTRFADDWVIQCETEKQAMELLREMKKYFRHKLKLELSDEKTFIKDMKKEPITFLGFNIIAELPRWVPGKPKPKRLIGKNYPNPKKVVAQTARITSEIQSLKQKPVREWPAEIERINQIITGVAEYWKTGTSKRTLTKIDNSIYQTSKAVFGRVLGNVGLHKYFVPLNQLSNLPLRHQGRIDKTYAVKHGDLWIGFTKAQITPIQYQKAMINQSMTPYTAKGRRLYESISKSKLPMDRPPLYNSLNLLGAITDKGIYNFEYYMNREYSYNRDKGECNVCKTSLISTNRQCHHKKPWLPLNEVNKVPNLVWLCGSCHNFVHSKLVHPVEKFNKKINKLRESLTLQKGSKS